MAYAAAAVTSESTDGVAALIVAVAAAVGAANSQGCTAACCRCSRRRSSAPSSRPGGPTVFERAGSMLAGCVYGVILGITLLRNVEVKSRAVHPQTALSYAVLLAVLVLIAWPAARVAEFAHGWWLPLAAAAIGGPRSTGARARGGASRHGTARDAAARSADPVSRRPGVARPAGGRAALLMLTVGRQTAALQALLDARGAARQHRNLGLGDRLPEARPDRLRDRVRRDLARQVGALDAAAGRGPPRS